jgi:hypothetical protein
MRFGRDGKKLSTRKELLTDHFFNLPKPSNLGALVCIQQITTERKTRLTRCLGWLVKCSGHHCVAKTWCRSHFKNFDQNSVVGRPFGI